MYHTWEKFGRVNIGEWANSNHLAGRRMNCMYIATTDYKRSNWCIKLANDILVAKFANFFPLKNFPTYGICTCVVGSYLDENVATCVSQKTKQFSKIHILSIQLL